MKTNNKKRRRKFGVKAVKGEPLILPLHAALLRLHVCEDSCAHPVYTARAEEEAAKKDHGKENEKT